MATRMAASIAFSAKGNTVGFDSAGRAVIGWRGKDKLWHAAQVGEQMADYLTNGTHKVFDTHDELCSYAMTKIDAEKTRELGWW